MNTRTYVWITLLSVVLLSTGCDNAEEPTVYDQRYLYYGIGESSSQYEGGFYRYDLLQPGNVEVDSRHTVNCTSVANNGIVLYEVQEGSQKLYGRCEDGNIIAVPFPVSGNPLYEYHYGMPPGVALSYFGHHAVYPVQMRLKSSTNPEKYFPHIVLFDCARWEMTIIPASDIIVDGLEESGAEQSKLTGDNIIVSTNGDAVWFSAVGLTGEEHPKTTGYALFEWSHGKSRRISGIHGTEVVIDGYNDRTKTLICREGNKRWTLHTPSGRVKDIPDGTGTYPQQVCNNYDAIVIWDNKTLSAWKASDGSYLHQVTTVDYLSKQWEESYVLSDNDRISVAPDGLWIAFTLTRKSDPESCDLFVSRNNGSDILRLDQNVRHGCLSMSPLLQQ